MVIWSSLQWTSKFTSPSTTMDQVIPNLWLGNIASISDVENLKDNNIHSILSAMRGIVVVQGVSVPRKGA